MVLYGLDGMTHRSQAYGLLAVGLPGALGSGAAALHRPWKAGKAPFSGLPPAPLQPQPQRTPGPVCPGPGRGGGGHPADHPAAFRFSRPPALPRGAGLAAGAGRRPGGLYPALDPEGELLQIHRSGSDSARLRHPRPPSPADPPFRRLSPLRFRLLHPVLRPRLAGRRLLSCPLRLLHPAGSHRGNSIRGKENPPKVKNPLYILEDPCYNNGAH